MKKILGAAVLVLVGGFLVAYEASTRHVVHGAPSEFSFTVSERPHESLSFIAVGDTGTGDWRQRRVARAMAREAEESDVDHVLHLGDIFYREGVESVDDPQWQEKFEEMYEHALDDVPFRPVAGNHDHLGDPDALVAYSAKSSRWEMPSLFYTFERVLGDWSVQFFALDTTLIVTSDEQRVLQLRWLADELAKSEARWKIVFGHHTIHSGDDAGGVELLRRELEPILLANDVAFYLSGHDHYLALLEPEGKIRQVISGAGAKPEDVSWTDDTSFAFADLGFVVLNVSRDEIEIRFLDEDDEILFARQISKDVLPASPIEAGASGSH